MEIPTSAKVRFTTSKGSIDVELYAHELPASCRAFLQNCMDNKYVGLEFGKLESLHLEVTPKSLDTKIRREFHSRVKFSARGNIALLNIEESSMASPDGFFITLNPQPEFNNRYVVVGKVVGDLIYNVVKILEGETTEDGVTPKYPVRITGVEVLQPYFDDLTKTEKKVEVQEPKRKKAKAAVKLSYDDDGDEDDKFVMRSAHELLRTGKSEKKSTEEDSAKKKDNEEESGPNVGEDEKEEEKEIEKGQNSEEVIKSDNGDEDDKGDKHNQEENHGEGNEITKPETTQDIKPDDTEHSQSDKRHDSSEESSDEETEPKPDPSVDPYDPVIDVWKDKVDFSTLQNHRYVCR